MRDHILDNMRGCTPCMQDCGVRLNTEAATSEPRGKSDGDQEPSQDYGKQLQVPTEFYSDSWYVYCHACSMTTHMRYCYHADSAVDCRNLQHYLCKYWKPNFNYQLLIEYSNWLQFSVLALVQLQVHYTLQYIADTARASHGTQCCFRFWKFVTYSFYF